MITEYLPYAACLCGGAIFGFLACAVLTAGKVADATGTGVFKEVDGEMLPVSVEEMWEVAQFHQDSHSRCADALAAKNARIQTLTDIARSQQSIKSGRIIDVLEG